ncbi:hypothetical protein D9M72_641930 [compost metagenome]
MFQAVAERLHLGVHVHCLAARPVDIETQNLIEAAWPSAQNQPGDREFRVRCQWLLVELLLGRVVLPGLRLVRELVGEYIKLAGGIVDADDFHVVAVAEFCGQ